jgi:hypothetical protein
MCRATGDNKIAVVHQLLPYANDKALIPCLTSVVLRGTKLPRSNFLYSLPRLIRINIGLRAWPYSWA